MKKGWALATAVMAAMGVTVGTTSTAGAIPEHKAETWVCEGEEVTLVAGGRSGWIDGDHYLAVYLDFVGVFTPEEGGEPQFEGEQKVLRQPRQPRPSRGHPLRGALRGDDPGRGHVRR